MAERTPGLEDVGPVRERLLALRKRLREEGAVAPTPAVARSLEQADMYLFLAVTYLGYSGELFPEPHCPSERR